VSVSRVPASIEARARSASRFGAAFGPRFFILLAAGFLWIGPAFYEPRVLFAVPAWDVLVLAVWLIDLVRLPAPAHIAARRSWGSLIALSVASTARVTVSNRSDRAIRVRLVDAVPHQLRAEAPTLDLALRPRSEAEGEYRILPRERGPIAVGSAYIRYRSPIEIAERWARVDLDQTIIVYPNIEEARRESMFLIRNRQTDAERRSRSIRGTGRLFESLRDHQDGDEFRDVCWTASARRGKLITRLYEAERSQPIWVVIDAGRLMRARLNEVTKLDHAVNAALTLAQVANGSGDRIGLLAYGRRVAHSVAPGRGSSHLGELLRHLALVRAEEGEPDHFGAAARLMTDQKRRSLVVWITDVPDVAMTPDVIHAASKLMPRHLVLLVVIGQPDLGAMTRRRPDRVDEMYRMAAAQEVVHRRELLLARIRVRGALAIEATGNLSPALVNAYLEVKQRSRL
jgi:uncharacterized protein (DUF58 family)